MLDPGVRVSAETARRIACDAGVVRMVHAADGAVLDVGRRTRVVPAPIRRALDHRDRGCRFPGCRSRFCDAHHIVHWADGGATRLDNLALLCRFHQTAVHEHGYRVWIESAEVRFARPDGRPLEAAPPPPPLVGDPVDKMVSAHEAAGLTIGPDTATPQWSGGRLDLGYALLTLLD